MVMSRRQGVTKRKRDRGRSQPPVWGGGVGEPKRAPRALLLLSSQEEQQRQQRAPPGAPFFLPVGAGNHRRKEGTG